jgi:hypothetical protein
LQKYADGSFIKLLTVIDRRDKYLSETIIEVRHCINGCLDVLLHITILVDCILWVFLLDEFHHGLISSLQSHTYSFPMPRYSFDLWPVPSLSQQQFRRQRHSQSPTGIKLVGGVVELPFVPMGVSGLCSKLNIGSQGPPNM